MNRAEVRKRALYLLKHRKLLISAYSGPDEWSRALVAVLCLEYEDKHLREPTYKRLCEYFKFPRVCETSYGFNSVLIEMYGKENEGKVLTNE